MKLTTNLYLFCWIRPDWKAWGNGFSSRASVELRQYGGDVVINKFLWI
jgi:hypothetical protein